MMLIEVLTSLSFKIVTYGVNNRLHYVAVFVWSMILGQIDAVIF